MKRQAETDDELRRTIEEIDDRLKMNVRQTTLLMVIDNSLLKIIKILRIRRFGNSIDGSFND